MGDQRESWRMGQPGTHYGLNELAEAVGKPDERPRGAWVVFGGQAGSEGKGAVAGYLARRYEWGAAICTFMTNAGHTWRNGDEKVVVQQLPMAVVSQSVGYLLIGPGAAITLEQLFKEIDEYDPGYDVTSRLVIHPRAMIIEQQDRDAEQERLGHIASTAKGCGAAIARKVMRGQDVRLAREEPKLRQFIGDTTKIANGVVNSGSGLLVEQAQGFDLDINHGVEYPYCTSRGTTPMQILADIGVDGRMVMRNIAVIRSHPIRVGSTDQGSSGPYGSEEISWDEVSHRAGRAVEERTTVTQRVRRVFELDLERLREMSAICRPTDIAFTFADYVDPASAGWTNKDMTDAGGLTPKLDEKVWEIEKAVRRPTASPRIRLIKTGADDADMIDMLGL